MSDQPHPAAWHPDPTGRNQFRYWNGTEWTEDVSNNGVVTKSPLQSGLADALDQGLSWGSDPDAAQVQQMLTDTSIRGAGIQAAVPAGDGSIWGEKVMVVSQKAKLIEVTNEYSVLDQQGNKIAAVTEVGQSSAKKALRVLTNLDQFMTHRLEITDRAGQVQLRLTRPSKIMKSTVIVEHPNGGELGRIVQENVFGKIRFSLQANGQALGSINAENWRAWNFSIQDLNGTEIARITKTWEGLAKAVFTTADNYVVQLHADIPQPLHSLVVAAALTVDTALKQDSN
jgi:uncharacterized protein YxjI